ncbi:MAG TPA: CobD/CbiB family protein [Burkholderiales bacterium]
MGVVAIVAALVIEQWRPLGEWKSVPTAFAAWGGGLERAFNGGERRHGLVAWLVAILPAVAAVGALYALLAGASVALALAFNVAVLYLTLGFRQFSHYFTDIQLAVKSGDLDRARSLLAAWRGASGVLYTREEVIRLSIEEALLASHRHVFGVLLWYLLLPGPCGAVLYRLAAYLGGRWRNLGAFGEFARGALRVLEWPAVRLTAAAFAIVGDFEDAVYCWRTQAGSWPDPEAGIVLAAGAGAMGVRLGMAVQDVEGAEPRPDLGVGDPADAPFLDSTVGLLWRAVVLWIVVLAMLAAARLL